MVVLENVSKEYSTRSGPLLALNNINLTIDKGSVFGIIGQSGAGKSTLIRCINLLERPTRGKVLIDNQNLLTMSQAELRQVRHQLAMIFQHFNLLTARTVYQNVALPLKLLKFSRAAIRKKVMSLLEIVGLTDKHDTYPAQLSGGQKQRVAIARSLACDPKVLLCDEATSALDPQTTESILNLLKKINRELDLTIILITHEMSVIKFICDQVAVLENGSVIEQSEALRLFTHPQTATTQAMINSCIKPKLPRKLTDRFVGAAPNNHPVIQILFYGEMAKQPIITLLIKQLGAQVNILQANIDYIKDQVLGVMVLELIATAEQHQKIYDYLKKLGLPMEILGYVTTDAD